MNNFFQKQILIKENLSRSISSENSKIQKYQQIEQNGKAVYLYRNFNFEDFLNNLYNFLHSELKLETVRENQNELTEIIYKSSGNFANMIKANAEFILLFYKQENVLFFDIELAENLNPKNEKLSKLSFTSLINQSHKKEISNFIYETIYKDFIIKNPQKIINFENTFIEETHFNERLFIGNIIENEQVLAKLNLSSIKNKDNTEDIKMYNSTFLITDKSVAVFAFNKTGDCVLFEQFEEKFKIKKGLSKMSLVYEKIIFYPKRSNKKMFYQLKDIQDFEENSRIREFVKYNYLSENYKFASIIISELIQKEKTPLNSFVSLIVSLKLGKEIEKQTLSEDDIKESINDILASKHSEKKIKNIFEEWQMTEQEKIFFLKMFSETAENKNEKKAIIPLYESVRKQFKKDNKDIINITVFDISYAEFLINAERKRKAVRVLKNLLKHLPDETVSDILPSEKLDISGKKSGQLLKIKILELIKLAKGREESEEEIIKSVQLQPLYEPNLQHLAETKNKNLKEKASKIISLLNEKETFSETKEIPVKKYNKLKNNILENEIRHPATINGGSFYSIQKWISKLKPEDYTSLKEFAEKITSANNKTLFEILDNIRHIFNVPELEFYISRGERSQGIVGCEGTPPFIIIGQNHLEKENSLFLNFNELQFSVAVETAHIYFKHSKISAHDVWRGVADKGSLLIDALLGFVPVAGIIGKSLKYSEKLKKLTNILVGANKVSGVKNVIDSAKKISEYYNKNKDTSTKVKNSQKLLLASRLMQFTADRAGLLISGDIKFSVKAILLTSKHNSEFIEKETKKSIKEILLKTDDEGKFIYQDIALRIAHLISFYVSDVFDKARKELLKNE